MPKRERHVNIKLQPILELNIYLVDADIAGITENHIIGVFTFMLEGDK